ncbi:molybdopterin-dependent oxidoreductase [Cognatishimia activa]|uniref:Oxidoreductase molybdopterin binding domain protein n=1 Tax=Cognatishimia activa TaxID=1715691 RepID=A0A0P1IX00_9RHOB|nr:molybdopterin-dependent oxidoreductase [Cognatishimia activa]CUI68061.1 Oxidoreductase molybdopterin binding domain protein [Cognatishimia activa]CUK26494.1 Oxidoreductase molybdopterin binding domain protein [Cognatishimia activa]
MSRFLCIFLGICVVAFSTSVPGHAKEVVQGPEPVLLEITDISSREKEVTISLDLPALDGMENQEIVTSTIWTNGVNRFEGVRLTELLKNLDLSGNKIRVTAINDYAVEFALNEPLNDDAIVAFRMNGEPMSRRGKGPLWLLYPFDQSAKYRTETIYARSVWQLNRIDVIE